MLSRVGPRHHGRIAIVASFFDHGDQLVVQALEVTLARLATLGAGAADGDQLGVAGQVTSGSLSGSAPAAAELAGYHLHERSQGRETGADDSRGNFDDAPCACCSEGP